MSQHLAITRIKLHPVIAFDGRPPDHETLEKLHHWAHRNCINANSVGRHRNYRKFLSFRIRPPGKVARRS